MSETKKIFEVKALIAELETMSDEEMANKLGSILKKLELKPRAKSRQSRKNPMGRKQFIY